MLEAKKLQLAILYVLSTQRHPVSIPEIKEKIRIINAKSDEIELPNDEQSVTVALDTCIDDRAAQKISGRYFIDPRYGDDWIRILRDEVLLMTYTGLRSSAPDLALPKLNALRRVPTRASNTNKSPLSARNKPT